MDKPTIEILRNKILVKLDRARQEVATLEGQLLFFDALVNEGGINADATQAKPGPKFSLSAGRIRSEVQTTIGAAAREAILSMKEDFTVPVIIKTIQPRFPDTDYESLSRRVSAVAYRLEHNGKVVIAERGAGRIPHTYRVVGAKNDSVTTNPQEEIEPHDLF